MKKRSVFSEINDKRFDFPYGIVSLPLSHPSLKKTRPFKQKDQRIEIFLGRKREVVRN